MALAERNPKSFVLVGVRVAKAPGSPTAREPLREK
jgi:hypothetical protein